MRLFLSFDFIDNGWVLCYIIVRLFETHNTLIGTTLDGQVNFLLVKYGFTNKIITYVNNEGVNLNALFFVLTHVVSYAPL